MLRLGRKILLVGEQKFSLEQKPREQKFLGKVLFNWVNIKRPGQKSPRSKVWVMKVLEPISGYSEIKI